MRRDKEKKGTIRFKRNYVRRPKRKKEGKMHHDIDDEEA